MEYSKSKVTLVGSTKSHIDVDPDWFPVTAARVSHGKDGKTGENQENDVKLMKFLKEHNHNTPFEHTYATFKIECPLFVRSEWHRHRTQCLAGDTELHFDLPSKKGRKSKLYKKSIASIYRAWQPTKSKREDKQGNPLYKRERIMLMDLRSLDESSNLIYATGIEDIWESGVKQIYKVTLDNGAILRCSKDHKIYGLDGWDVLDNYAVGDMVYYIGRNLGQTKDFHPPKILNDEIWKPCYEWEDKYEVSSYGRVRRIGKYNPKKKIKTPTYLDRGTAVVSLSKGGTTYTYTIGHLVLKSFGFNRAVGEEVRHINGNFKDNRLENLMWGSPQENALDKIRHGTSGGVTANAVLIKSIKPDGMEMTYDIAVRGPYHNFSANGFVVHNSYNEISMRYTSSNIGKMFKPEKWRKQADRNKQSSQGRLDYEDEAHADGYLAAAYEHCLQAYEALLKLGVAREQARMVIPVGHMTEFYASANLLNWHKFCKLRCAEDAQFEIRELANEVNRLLEELYPNSWKVLNG